MALGDEEKERPGFGVAESLRVVLDVGSGLSCLVQVSRTRDFYFDSLAPNISNRSINGGEASRLGACSIRALAMGPFRCC